MHRQDNHALKNASLKFKVATTFWLLLSIALMLWSWFISYTVIEWYSDPMRRDLMLGKELEKLAWTNANEFAVLFFLQAVAYIGLLIVSKKLLRRSALRRRTKKAMSFAANILVALNLFAWLALPVWDVARAAVGSLGFFSSAILILMPLPALWQMWLFKRWRPADPLPKKVVIIGGGFAGLYTALGLDKTFGYHAGLELTVIDQNNFFLFPPLLPSAAVGTIEMQQVTYPFRRIFETTNIVFKKGTVVSINPTERRVRMHVHLNDDMANEKPEMTGQDLEYDYLVLAPGSVNQTFNTKGVGENALFMRELEDTMRVRNRIIECFEAAATAIDPNLQRQLLRFVIVGGGPTGIEIATEIHDMIEEVLLRRYPEIQSSWPEVYIVQSGPELLRGWNEHVVKKTTEQIRKLGVRVILNTRVIDVETHAVSLKDGSVIEARTCIWCAGVQPAPLMSSSGLALDKSGRAVVTDDLRVAEFPDIFVLGDAAAALNKKDGRQLPPLGQVAFQQGDHTAKNLARLLRGQPTKPFQYFNFGSLVSVGEHYAAVNLLGVRLSGFIGWIVWRTLYLSKIIGMSNRIRIVIDWTLDLLIERSITQYKAGERKQFTDDE
jgi:NADH dehydrogenase